VSAAADEVIDVSSAVTEVRDWRQWGESSDAMIDEIAERVSQRMMEGVCDALVQRVADQVLERLAMRILGTPREE
jgi:hypothetical protein